MVVSWPCAAACPHVLLCTLSRPPRPCRWHSRQYRGAFCAVSKLCRCHIAGRVATHPSSQASACHDITDCIVTHSSAARPLSCHDINDCIVTHPWSGLPSVTIQRLYRDTLHQPGPARARCRPYRKPPGLIVAVSWPYRGRIVACCAVSWHAPACYLPALPSLAVSRYNMLYRDPAQTENGQ